MQTVVTNKLPIKLFVINNDGYHQIRQTQNNIFHNGLIGVGAESGDLGFPDFEKLAYAFDIPYTKIQNREDFDRLDGGLADGRPHLFEVVLSPTTQVVPEPAPRRAVEDQLPLLDRKEFDHLHAMDDLLLKDEKI